MLQRHFLRTSAEPPRPVVLPQPNRLLLDIRPNSEGRRVLHWKFQAFSDPHLLSRFSKAKLLTGMLQNTSCDILMGVGDMVDGLAMMDKDRFNVGPWHRQVIARMTQKAEDGTEVNILPGNHEPGLRKKIGKGTQIYGLNLIPDSEYTDPKDRRFLITHGDMFDRELFQTEQKQAYWYKFGDAALHCLSEIDLQMHRIRILQSRSVAAAGKRLTKTIINNFMGVNNVIARHVDDDPLYHGIISGHSHMGGFSKTPKEKLLINDGCCTEHVQFATHDKNGNWGIVTYRRDRMDIEMETGEKYSQYWADIGLDHFSKDPEPVENQHTQQADRLLRIAARMWPSKGQVEIRQKITLYEKIIDTHVEFQKAGAAIPDFLALAFHRATSDLDDLWAKSLRNPVSRPRFQQAPERAPEEAQELVAVPA